MSRSSTRPRRSALVGTATLALLAPCAAAAPAAAAPLDTVAVPLRAVAAESTVTATGNDVAAWVTTDHPGSTTADARVAVWTVRDGLPVQVATIPAHQGGRTLRFAVGTGTDDRPVGVLETVDQEDGGSVLRLIDLTTGRTRRLSQTFQRRDVGGLAIDHGRLYFTLLKADFTSPRSTAALWQRSVRGLDVGAPRLVRTSRRGEQWLDVIADRGRVALRTYPRTTSRRKQVLELAFGTPRGRWTRVLRTIQPSDAQDGNSELPQTDVTAEGFTTDGSLVATRFPPTGAATTMRLPAGGGRARSVPGGFGAFAPSQNRFLHVGPDPTGALTVGWSPVVFP